jgi:hypothetical protein
MMRSTFGGSVVVEARAARDDLTRWEFFGGNHPRYRHQASGLTLSVSGLTLSVSGLTPRAL